MSRFPEIAGAALAVLTLCAAPAHAGKYNLGRAATAAEIKGWDIDVRPDGQGLPEGKGSVMQGDRIFQEQCAACHGDFAEGRDRWPVLAGGQGSLTSSRPEKTIGSYWPYLSTVYDYIFRAMPYGNAQSLSPDEVYALTAYLLYMNDLVDEDFELSKSNFSSIHLPNEKNFVEDPRPDIADAKKEPCMTDCKGDVKITKRAAVLDVTPDDDKNPSAGID